MLRRLSALVCSVIPVATAHAQAVNDTGVAIGGDALSGNSAACNGVEIAQQDCSVGRDALARAGKLAKTGAGAAGFDFTRVCNSGEAAGSGACPAEPKLGRAPGEWACTKDNLTGLLWEVKTADDGPRDRDRTYTQFSEAYNPGKELGSATDAAGFARDVNAARLCGAAAWRLPTRLELIGLLHYGAAGPVVDAVYFPNPPSKPAKAVYWTASGFAGNPANAWGIDASDGVAGDDNRAIYYAVRLVAAPPAAERKLTAAGAEVGDASTGLVWRRCVEGMSWNGTACSGAAERYSWAGALARAKSEAAAAREKWRVPDLKELASLVDEAKVGPAIDAALFPGTPVAWFWSSTPASGNPAYSWVVNFRQGHLGDHGYRADRYPLRLVRNAR